MTSSEKQDKQLTGVEAISDNLTCEAYDNGELHVRDFDGKLVIIEKRDLMPLINYLFNDTEMVGGMLCEKYQDRTMELSRTTGPVINFSAVEHAKFAGLLRAHFGNVR